MYCPSACHTLYMALDYTFTYIHTFNYICTRNPNNLYFLYNQVINVIRHIPMVCCPMINKSISEQANRLVQVQFNNFKKKSYYSFQTEGTPWHSKVVQKALNSPMLQINLTSTFLIIVLSVCKVFLAAKALLMKCLHVNYF